MRPYPIGKVQRYKGIIVYSGRWAAQIYLGIHLLRFTKKMYCLIDKMTAQIRGALRSPVADRTGLTGTYDLNLLFMPEGRTPEPDLFPLKPTRS